MDKLSQSNFEFLLFFRKIVYIFLFSESSCCQLSNLRNIGRLNSYQVTYFNIMIATYPIVDISLIFFLELTISLFFRSWRLKYLKISTPSRWRSESDCSSCNGECLHRGSYWETKFLYHLLEVIFLGFWPGNLVKEDYSSGEALDCKLNLQSQVNVMKRSS